MRKKTIYLIRHGETDYNKKGIVQGSGIDSSLNETGHKQAKAFYDHYSHISFHKVYTSQLVRTHQSVINFLNDGVSHEILPGLNEISWGSKEGKKPDPSDDEVYFNVLKRWSEGETHLSLEGGESPEEVLERQKIALDRIIENENEETVLVAMHGRAIRILLTFLSEASISEMDTFKHSNLCLYKLEYSYEENKFSILERNNIEHLSLISV